MRRPAALLAAAAAVITWWGALFAISQQVSVITGLYWSVTTATTVGYGDVIARGTGGQLLAIADMLTTIPLLAAAFGAIHLGKVRQHVDDRLSEHHQAIHDRLDQMESQVRKR